MDCKQVQNWLLEAESPRPQFLGSGEISTHLTGCSACRSLANKLVKLEQAWQAIPLPPGADQARQRFLERLPAETAARRPGRPVLRWVPRWAMAAAVLLTLGLAAWFLTPTPHAQATPALIERLVDWNLDLADVPSAAERKQLYSATEDDLKQAVRQASLTEPERQLADLLLENATWLAENDDPVGAAERFSAVADRLVGQLQSAGDRKDMKRAKRYARLQALVAQHGVEDNLEKAKTTGALNFDKQRRLEKVVLRDAERMQTLVELLEQQPDLSRREIRKALDIPRRRPKKPTPSATTSP
jgi:hypothetical protein